MVLFAFVSAVREFISPFWLMHLSLFFGAKFVKNTLFFE